MSKKQEQKAKELIRLMQKVLAHSESQQEIWYWKSRLERLT